MAFGNAEFVVEFDAPTVARLTAMTAAAPVMARFYLVAMEASTQHAASVAQQPAYAPVGVYTNGRTGGRLKEGIRGFAESPFMGRVGVLDAIPYARRREYGFDGREDSLKRYFPQDPIDADKRAHMMYLHRAVTDSFPFIMSAFHINTQLAIREINAV